eukprot:5052456-Prymnesium_polylepis.1
MKGGKGPEGRLRNTDVSSASVACLDSDLTAIDKRLNELVKDGTMLLCLADMETNITFFFSESDAIKFAGCGDSVKGGGVRNQEISELKDQLQSALDAMGKNQAKASEQIQETNSE